MTLLRQALCAGLVCLPAAGCAGDPEETLAGALGRPVPAETLPQAPAVSPGQPDAPGGLIDPDQRARTHETLRSLASGAKANTQVRGTAGKDSLIKARDTHGQAALDDIRGTAAIRTQTSE
ncbi:hypothetical protein GCM10011316_28540 [Roseibium aquae]|uniref:Uncharacterized protein n=1 Tax=Roseibium aquae TaxID=1323746 RepID=A0A916TLA9_9HYPH|nr:hypothetical protein [Roseibium aquae]GGB54767.1 hypothetical protein GCM10011316_28540 [Roseibium aquae]